MAILDFSKPFDKVIHSSLIRELNFYSIRGTLLHWIKSFLTNRTQQVVVSGDYPSPYSVTSGVPQGSVCFIPATHKQHNNKYSKPDAFIHR